MDEQDRGHGRGQKPRPRSPETKPRKNAAQGSPTGASAETEATRRIASAIAAAAAISGETRQEQTEDKPTKDVGEPDLAAHTEGPKKMEKSATEGIYENMNQAGKAFFNGESTKKFAAWYVDTAERLANEMLDIQATATGWAKETPLAPIFEAQNDLGRKFVKRSAEAARKVWQIEA